MIATTQGCKTKQGVKELRKFGNTANKVKAILSVMRKGEKLKCKDITRRLRSKGYDADEGNINMFIYHYMLYKYLARERINGVNYYYPT